MKKIVVTGLVREEGLSLLRDFAELVELYEPIDAEKLAKELVDADGLLHKMGKLGRPELQGQTKLKMIARHGVGLDYLDVPYIKSLNIPVSITLTANSNAVAEASVGLLISVLRNFRQGEKMLKVDKKWARETLMGGEIRGRTVGIIGYGRVGSIVGRILDAFGANIIVNDIAPKRALDDKRTVVGFEELMRTADVVSLHLPLTELSANLINAKSLAWCKKGVIIINTARGGILDTHAVVEAANSGQIGAVATDAFTSEPPDFNSELFLPENIMTTPHISAMTLEAQVAVAVNAATELRRVLVEGLPPTNNIFDEE